MEIFRFIARRGRGIFLVSLLGFTAFPCPAQEESADEAPAALEDKDIPDEGQINAELIIVQGTPGEEGYAEDFAASVEHWKKAAEAGLAKTTFVGPEHEEQRSKFKKAVEAMQPDSPIPLWIVLIGHGTFDRRAANFNLTGADVSALDLGQWLEEFKRPIILIHGGAASAPYIRRLSREGRVIISATRTGTEINYTRFGSNMARSLLDPEADLDNDGQASVYECFIHAARQTNAFYETNGLLATEHALIDDNGDGRGSSLELLERFAVGGARIIDGDYARLWSLVLNEAEKKLTPDQRRRRNVLERKILELRRKRDDYTDESAFYAAVEPILIQIATIYAENEEEEEEKVPAGDDSPPDEDAAAVQIETDPAPGLQPEANEDDAPPAEEAEEVGESPTP